MDSQKTQALNERDQLRLELKESQINAEYMKNKIIELQEAVSVITHDKLLLEKNNKELKTELEQITTFLVKELHYPVADTVKS